MFDKTVLVMYYAICGGDFMKKIIAVSLFLSLLFLSGCEQKSTSIPINTNTSTSIIASTSATTYLMSKDDLIIKKYVPFTPNLK